VLVGYTLLLTDGRQPSVWIALFALLSATMIQIGTNYINDALDFEKGADHALRLGEARATQRGWFSKRFILTVGALCFLGAVLFGLPLAWIGGWPIVCVGVVSVLMGYLYTGGPFPLAYIGLGDLFVVVFFGLVAVGGVYFLGAKTYGWPVFVAGLQVGLLATVLIAINNLRDLEQDEKANKKTLAVRLGPRLGRLEVLILILTAFSLGLYWLNRGRLFAFVLPMLALPQAYGVLRTLLKTQASRQYNHLLAQAAWVHILFGILLSAGFLLH
jgi:1,4-dihydroxy-2-naphthoate octaprenyltransferase